MEYIHLNPRAFEQGRVGGFSQKKTKESMNRPENLAC